MLSSIRCLTDEAVQRFLDGSLDPIEEEGARQHLDRCSECRSLVADLVRQGSIDGDSIAYDRLQLPESARTVREGERVAESLVVGKLLGHGGMGYVVAARHDGLGATVAMKFLRAELALDQSAIARFLREAQIAASIKSPHCVRVHDVGTTPGGVPYIVMEHLEGRSLSTVLAQEQPLEARQAVGWILEAGDAVAEAHDNGIVHRDLKLQNLFLAERGGGLQPWIKVLDFGLAKHLRSRSLTLPEELLGTPHYMAPEQIKDPRSVGPAADIWALGACLYRLLTGEHPFPGLQRTAICAAIVKDEPRAIRELRAKVPDALASIVHECLAKDPARRPESVRELVRRLASSV